MGKVLVSADLPGPALDRPRAEHEVEVGQDPIGLGHDGIVSRAGEAGALNTLVSDRVDERVLLRAGGLKAPHDRVASLENDDDIKWASLSEGARAHARALAVLRRPAPREVVLALGSDDTERELVETGVLTSSRVQGIGGAGEPEWVERWGMRDSVAGLASGRLGEEERRAAHRAAAEAHDLWVKGPRVLGADVEEGIFHWHAVEEGDRVWPSARQYVLWLREKERFREALRVLLGCEAARTTGESLSEALMLIAQMRRSLGEHSNEIGALLDRALGLAASDERRGEVLDEQGDLLRHNGEYAKAEARLREAVAIKERALGAGHPSHGASLNGLAAVLYAQRKYSEAEPLIRRALEMGKTDHGPDHPEVAQLLNVLARTQAELGKLEARDTAREALDALSTSLGPDHPITQEIAPRLREIASGATLDAAPSSAAALAAQLQEGKAALGANDPDRAVALLAQLIDRAREAGLPALIASASGTLAQAYFALGELDDALTHARRALAIAEELKQERAAQHFRELIRLIESAASKIGDPDQPDWNARIRAALDQGKAGDADAAFQTLVELAEEAHAAGAQGPEASARIYLGQMLLARGEPAFAAAELLCALAIAEELGDERAAAHIRALLAQAEGSSD